MLWNSGLAACCSKANTWEMSIVRKRKFVLFGRLATWIEGVLMSKNQLPYCQPGGKHFFFLILIFYFLYCSGFCHTLKWNSHGFTCAPHPDPPSHLPLHLIPLGLPSAPGLSSSTFKGEFQGYRQRKVATCRNSIVTSNNHLRIGHPVVWSVPSWLF